MSPPPTHKHTQVPYLLLQDRVEERVQLLLDARYDHGTAVTQCLLEDVLQSRVLQGHRLEFVHDPVGSPVAILAF